MDIWKPIPGFESYEVSNAGQVRRVGSDIIGRNRYINHVLKPDKTAAKKRGDKRIALHGPCGAKRYFVHQLVMLAFVGPCPEKHNVNHKNGDPTDNRPENLEYTTQSQNYRHALNVLGFQPPHGVKHWNAKLSETDVAAIKLRYATGMESQQSIADEFGVRQNTICRIINGTRRRRGA